MKTRKPLTPEAAQIRAEELCARAEHSSGEIREKLLKWGVFPGDAERIVAAMIKTRFIDDARFARAYVRDKIEFSRWGKRKVALGLYQKKVSREIIKDTLDDVDDEKYKEALRMAIASKKRTMSKPDTYEGRTKLFRFAASRGFEPDIIIAVLREKDDAY